MECKQCGSDGDVIDFDHDTYKVVLEFTCFNEECSTYGKVQFYTYDRS